jgi:hypothetical protein
VSKDSRRKSKNKKGKKKKTSSSASRPQALEPTPRRVREPLPSRAPHLSTMRRPDVLREAIATYLDLSGLNVAVRELRDGSAFGVYVEDRRVGSIAEKYASIGRHRPLGDFLTENAPWGRVRNNLLEALEEMTSQASVAGLATRPVSRVFPSSAGEAALSIAVESTRRIRTERAREYPFVATLGAQGGELTVHPVTPIAGGRVSFAFRFTSGRVVRGVLQLDAIGEVLPVTVDGAAADTVLSTAWVAVLSGFADLTCPSPYTGETGQMWMAEALTPTAGTARLINATVAGHRRRLGTKHHGEEAAERAAAIGVELASNETWVRSHTRGAPDDSVLEFDWTPAPELQGLLTMEDAGAEAA